MLARSPDRAKPGRGRRATGPAHRWVPDTCLGDAGHQADAMRRTRNPFRARTPKTDCETAPRRALARVVMGVMNHGRGLCRWPRSEPPKEYRFKPGQSGNPNVRQAQTTIARSRPQTKYSSARSIKRSRCPRVKRQRTMTEWTAWSRAVGQSIRKGRPPRTSGCVLGLPKRLGSNFLSPAKAFDEALASDRQEILDAYVARRTSPKASAAPRP